MPTPDVGIRQVLILKKLLPPPQPNHHYYIRYRIISEDRNRTSHWSSVHNLACHEHIHVDGEVAVNGRIITVVWGDDSNYPSYDILVKFNGGPYVYHGTSPIHTYSFINTGDTSVRVLIQVAGAVKEVNPLLTIFESSVVSLV